MSGYTAQFTTVSQPSEGVLLLSLNRAPVNAFHEPFWRELQALVEGAADDPDVRVVVLASALPKLFTAGLDLQDAAKNLMSSDGPSDTARKGFHLRKHILDFQAAISSLEQCSKPVIIAMHGLSYGLAIDMCLSADIRLASSDVRFAIKEVDVGLAADIGTLQRGPKLLSNGSLFRELALTGRDFGAEEAMRLGLLSRVVQGGQKEVLKEALDMAAVIASKSPVAVVGTKYLINASQHLSVQDGLQLTAAWNMAALQAEDMGTAVAAVMGKTRPTFSKL